MYEVEKRQIIEAGKKLKEYKLISLSGGNIALRVDKNRYLVTPSGMEYDFLVEDDICLIDDDCNVIEGRRKPSSDSEALVYIFKNKNVNAIIHTHQPYATAIGLVKEKLPLCMVTLIDACKYEVKIAPWAVSSDIGMGILCVEHMNDSNALILKNHGVMCFGEDLKEALYSAVYLEEGAKTYVLASLMGKVEELPEEEINKERSGWTSYGQK